MQECFRAHPDIYGSELDDDDEDAPGLEGVETPGAPGANPAEASHGLTASRDTKPDASHDARGGNARDEEEKGREERAKDASKQVKDTYEPQSESDSLVPKAAHDATTSSEGK